MLDEEDPLVVAKSHSATTVVGSIPHLIYGTEEYLCCDEL
jgi:hypothetical protein